MVRVETRDGVHVVAFARPPVNAVNVEFAEARRRADITAYGRVKLQVRAQTITCLHEIVDRDDEPLLERWI